MHPPPGLAVIASSVSVNPGDTVLTRIPWGASAAGCIVVSNSNGGDETPVSGHAHDTRRTCATEGSGGERDGSQAARHAAIWYAEKAIERALLLTGGVSCKGVESSLGCCIID